LEAFGGTSGFYLSKHQKYYLLPLLNANRGFGCDQGKKTVGEFMASGNYPHAIIEWPAIRWFVSLIWECLGRELYNLCQILSFAVKGHTEFIIAIP
jgi:hypothetical protein